MFLPGVELCRIFYAEAVRPLLGDLPHAAARVGPGSDVLGLDTERSADHDWGPRLELFLTPRDAEHHGERLHRVLRARLPKQIRGYPTHFEPEDARVRTMAATTGLVAHRVQITDVATWSRAQLGFDATAGVREEDWLATPAQPLAEATGGAVYHDDHGTLSTLRERLRWYPDEIWRSVLAAQWTRIAQEEAFVGRTAEVGDDLGSRIVAARLARDVMRLCLLLERRYPPYGKWLGSAFAALPGITVTAEALREALGTDDPRVRQEALCTAYEETGRRQNRLDLAPPVDARRRPFFDRPFPVIDAARFAQALRPRHPLGAIDQYVDSTDALQRPALTRTIAPAAGGTG